ncbi:secondary thiamine-phosphate synthase enzyme YjbQ [Poseidonocella sedimentorum]|uniref:Secondary thiamine-phosphate synthase enzyme n=1 Tax=Poseidonocella sedimentorum TaxID=871652 RepID=A0A1I6EQZ0_9RHOB|nr:secondary thiamine-phosphate synthase enzyme YjbQ [Poseidonocella sedimentorum]SFR19938.1 secondary thiamine-phosphate synthase enzyme [Poseidonocella sedimentorum]
MQTTFTITTSGLGLYEITQEVSSWVRGSGVLTLFLCHTSASLLIQENADPDVQTDLMAFFSRLVPSADNPTMQFLTHTLEGPDDMPAHIKAALLPVSLQIPVLGGRMRLGRWQGIYLMEHRNSSHRREIAAHLSVDGTS